MSRYQGYSDPLEVLIDILNEMREIKELLKPKEELKEEENEQPIQSTQGNKRNTTGRSRGLHKQ